MFQGFFKAEAAEPVEVRLSRIGENRYQVQLEERTQEVEILPFQKKTFLLRQGEKTIPFSCAKLENSVWVWLNGKTYVFEILESGSQNRKKPEVFSGIVELKAAMPGRIQKIFVKSGDKVSGNQPIFLLESMKMEITVSAPAACYVKEILCRAEEQVEMGKILARLEASDEPSVS